MPVIIEEIEHVPTPADPRRGGEEERRTSAAPAMPQIEARMMELMRREAGRRARLWAD